MYITTPISTNIEADYPPKVAFPVVAVCNNNQYRLTYMTGSRLLKPVRKVKKQKDEELYQNTTNVFDKVSFRELETANNTKQAKTVPFTHSNFAPFLCNAQRTRHGHQNFFAQCCPLEETNDFGLYVAERNAMLLPQFQGSLDSDRFVLGNCKFFKIFTDLFDWFRTPIRLTRYTFMEQVAYLKIFLIIFNF